MVEGHIVYNSFYYSNQCIKKIGDTPGTMVWDNQLDEDKKEAEIL